MSVRTFNPTWEHPIWCECSYTVSLIHVSDYFKKLVRFSFSPNTLIASESVELTASKQYEFRLHRQYRIASSGNGVIGGAGGC